MLEIQALQSLGSQQSKGVDSLLTKDSSVFSNMIDELLTNTTSNGQSFDVNSILGSVSSSTNLSSLLAALKSSNTDLGSISTTNVDTKQDSLTDLLYSGKNTPYIPSYLKSNYNSLEEFTTDYTGTEAFTNLLAGANEYASIIKKAADKYKLPEKLIASIMKKESNFDANAVSPAGAQGLMQLMPGTARYLGVTNAFDPEQNIMGGAKYLRQMLKQFDDNISLALAAYNAGPGNVKKYNGIPPFKETMNYVSKVLNYYRA